MLSVYFHGWSFDSSIWPTSCRQPQAHSYSCAPWPDDAALHEQIAQLAQQSGPLILIGWSLGATLALEVSLKQPDCVHGLILIGATPCFVATADFPHGQPAGVLRQLQRRLTRDAEAAVAGFRSLDALPLDAPCSDPQSLSRGLDKLRASDFRQQLNKIQQRCHVIHGINDPICPYEAGRYLADELPDATLHTFAASGHAPFLTEEAAFAKLLASLLEQFKGGTRHD